MASMPWNTGTRGIEVGARNAAHAVGQARCREEHFGNPAAFYTRRRREMLVIVHPSRSDTLFC